MLSLSFSLLLCFVFKTKTRIIICCLFKAQETSKPHSVTKIYVDHIFSFFREENRKRRAGEGVDNKKSYEGGGRGGEKLTRKKNEWEKPGEGKRGK